MEIRADDGNAGDDALQREMQVVQRSRELMHAMAAWGDMRNAMNLAQPDMAHDCWWTVGKTLCDIAQSIRLLENRDRK